MSGYKLISGTANVEFAKKVAGFLGKELAESMMREAHQM